MVVARKRGDKTHLKSRGSDWVVCGPIIDPYIMGDDTPVNCVKCIMWAERRLREREELKDVC